MNELIPPPDDLMRGLNDRRQQDMAWYPNTWSKWLDADHIERLRGHLPNLIGRAHVTDLARRAHETEAAAIDAFVASMVWGYGPVGYGAWRTARVLRENEGTIGTRLHEVAIAAHDEGPRAAFGKLASRRGRPKYLGPAFGTKYLYFCSSAHRELWDDRTAPVLDQVVRRWFSSHTEVRLDNTWSERNYGRYVALLEHWACTLEIASDRVEEIIFERQTSLDRKRTGRQQSSIEAEDDGGGLDALEALRVVLIGMGRADEAAEHLDALAAIIDPP